MGTLTRPQALGVDRVGSVVQIRGLLWTGAHARTMCVMTRCRISSPMARMRRSSTGTKARVLSSNTEGPGLPRRFVSKPVLPWVASRPRTPAKLHILQHGYE